MPLQVHRLVALFEYGGYLRNYDMKLDLYVSHSHDYCADSNIIIFQVCIESQNRYVVKKFPHKHMRIYPTLR